MIVANTGREVFQAMQQIVIQNKDQAIQGPVDEGGSVLVDTYSASMVVQVHEALAERNQERMMGMFEMLPLNKAVSVLWKVCHAGHTLH